MEVNEEVATDKDQEDVPAIFVQFLDCLIFIHGMTKQDAIIGGVYVVFVLNVMSVPIKWTSNRIIGHPDCVRDRYQMQWE